ncbi:MAG: hypothetical protein NVSMB3_14670 [Acidobacteriaceae bacterium]
MAADADLPTEFAELVQRAFLQQSDSECNKIHLSTHLREHPASRRISTSDSV